MRVLVVEDDRETADYICASLRGLGHVAEHAGDGQRGFLLALDGDVDVMVVDRMLPGFDGMSLVRSVRSDGVATPFLFLSALGALNDRVDGLEAGADDYLVKPFAFSELSARLVAWARRPLIQAEETRLWVADLELDLIRRAVSRAGQEIRLRPRGFRLLAYLMRNADRVVTRTMLLGGAGSSISTPTPTWSRRISAGSATRSTSRSTGR